MKTRIEQLLRSELAAQHVHVDDLTAQHAHHAGARESGGGHYLVTVVSHLFEGVNPVARHRLVYRAVAPLRPQIHALGITAHTPAEWKISGS
ncbi:MAG: BolA family transcriptional regulator [Candidatus Omnitrophica bacterium]|nr:BolA family transcriptional regulator [Candidatus Omnitrophota bacterium]MCB9722049.1 BolA family transcriptional regulator [Candidatus Omnitrophota bacterium]